jgi:hypothetical protein
LMPPKVEVPRPDPPKPKPVKRKKRVIKQTC